MIDTGVFKISMLYIKTKSDLVKQLKEILPENPVIVEAGAFNGTDTQLLNTSWPKGIIHAFEPVPAIYEQLIAAVQHIPAIHTYPYALSSHTGTALFYVSEKPTKPGKICQAGSLLKPKERLKWSSIRYPITIEVPTITLDAWALQQCITHLDFLWLDLQGMALSVLQASPHIISTVKVLWIEVEFVEAYEGQESYDMILEWLGKQGFEIKAQDFKDTNNWFFGNILAIRIST